MEHASALRIALGRVPSLCGRYTELDRSAVERTRRALRECFFDPEGRVRTTAGLESVERDISNDEPGTVRAFLRSTNLDQDGTCIVIWCRDEFGVQMPLALFIEQYDELWYPSRDDVWVAPLDQSWLIVLDHEEFVQFIRGAGETVSGSD